MDRHQETNVYRQGNKEYAAALTLLITNAFTKEIPTTDNVRVVGTLRGLSGSVVLKHPFRAVSLMAVKQAGSQIVVATILVAPATSMTDRRVT